MKRIHNSLLGTAALICALSVSSCLQKNDLAYPDVRVVISEFEVRGQTSAKLDPAKQTITVTLKEETDIKHQKLTKFKYTPTTVDMDTVIMNPFIKVGDTLNLSSDYKIKFTVYYRDSVWTVITKQPIERYVKAEGMIDSAKFDTGTYQATVNVIDTIDLSKVNIEDMKLGQKGSKIYTSDWKACEFPMTLDCRTAPVFYSVSKYQDTSKWTVTFVKTKVTAQIKSVNAWTSRASVEAMFLGENPVIELSDDGGKSWGTINNVVISGTSAKGFLNDLTPGTDYQVRIRVPAAKDTSKVFAFSTEKEAQIQNMNFDEWFQNGDRSDCPKPGPGVWDTPNTSVIGVETFVTFQEKKFLAISGTGKSATKLETGSTAGVLAAGTVYTGKFLEAILFPTGARMDWGTSFSSRPKTLKGYFAYEPKTISNPPTGYESWKNKTDSLQILVILADWDEPYHVDTSKPDGYLDQEKDPGIIARGHFETSKNTSKKYEQFEIPIEYRDTVRKPKWAIVISCSSYRGDHFCGAEGSTLYVDEFKFTY